MTVPRFWREIPQRYLLQGNQCGSCKTVHFPPRVICPTCRRASVGKMEPFQLSGSGTIVEWTRVFKAARGYEAQVPYVVALIKTDEGPVLTGQIVDGLGDPRTGQQVHSVFRRLGEDGAAGVIHYGTKWKPVTSDEEE